MAKDFVGLNICVRDIFQGTGDCGYSAETDGYSSLNTLGFTASNISGLNTTSITFNLLAAVANQNTFAITASGADGANVVGYAFTTSSVAPAGTCVVIDINGLNLATDAGRKALIPRIDAAFMDSLNLRKSLVSPTFNANFTTATYRYEHCYGHITGSEPGSTFNFSFSNTSGSSFYNDVPSSFIGSNGVLHAINLHRNGPYGWPSWKQIRAGENRINQHLRKNNKLTVARPEEQYRATYGAGVTKMVTRKNHGIVCFDEPAVSSKHHPLVFNVSKVIKQNKGSITRRFSIQSSYNNNITFFSNNEVNSLLKTPELEDENFELISNMYLRGNLEDEKSPIDSFEFLKFRQTVFPKEAYTFKGQTKFRSNYSNNYWRSSPYARVFSSSNAQFDNGFGTSVKHGSKWPLDGRLPSGQEFTNSLGYWTDEYWRDAHLNNFGISANLTGSAKGSAMVAGGTTNQKVSGAFNQGVLQNTYSQFAKFLGSASANQDLAPAPLYARRQSIVGSGSTTYNATHHYRQWPHISPSGPSALRLAELNMSQWERTKNYTDRFHGEAIWDTANHAGVYPFVDSIADFSLDIKNKYKDYSIIPEFKISDHVSFYSTNDVKKERLSLFEIPGGKLNSSSSSDAEFYKIYSTSDFLKNFDIIKREHENFVGPSAITLRCKAIKKFIPYDGFYPAQRTVELAKQFYSSYSQFVSTVQNPSGKANLKHGIRMQNLLNPLFAPGVLFNSIKSGVACDYPILTSSSPHFATSSLKPHGNDRSLNPPTQHGAKVNDFMDSSRSEGYPAGDGISNQNFYIASDFDYRVPFEALLDPENYLARREIGPVEPHPSGNLSSSVTWNGLGDDLYKKMAHNFVAEVPHFFLKDESFSSFTSLEQGDPNFGNAVAGKTYAMRVKMYRSMDSANTLLSNSGSNIKYAVPQDVIVDDRSETITMYSRPTGFGPPSLGQTDFQDGVVFSAVVKFKIAPNENDQWALDLPGGDTNAMSAENTWGLEWRDGGYRGGKDTDGDGFADTFDSLFTAGSADDAMPENATMGMWDDAPSAPYDYKSRLHVSGWGSQNIPGGLQTNRLDMNVRAFHASASALALSAAFHAKNPADAGNWTIVTASDSIFIEVKWTQPAPTSRFYTIEVNTGESTGDIASRIEFTGYPPSVAMGPGYSTASYVAAIGELSRSVDGPMSGAYPNGKTIFKDSRHGYNFPYTPPYYHGEAWADIYFTAMQTKKYTLAEILAQATPKVDFLDRTGIPVNGTMYHRFAAGPYGGESFAKRYRLLSGSGLGPQSMNDNRINKQAMQLDSTINLFGAVAESEIEQTPTRRGRAGNISVDAIKSNKDRWVIQPKFESPILNFKKYTSASFCSENDPPINQTTGCTPAAGSNDVSRIHQTSDGSRIVPRGMWHQLGELPTTNEGIYLQVSDIPNPWLKYGLSASSDVANNVLSLADLCGFRTSPEKLGQIANTRIIREAVVAIPFLDKGAGREFFSIPRKDVDNALDPETEPLVGKSVVDMVSKMQKFVLPPSMDFVNYESVEPFAMYIFEFQHTLSRDDVSYIWQGLSPSISRTHAEAESIISHELLSHELLGNGAKISVTEDGSLLDESVANNKFDSRIRWMVFKAKQRAQTDYYDKVIGNANRPKAAKGALIQKAKSGRTRKLSSKLSEENDITYNWPYDFFSLVELVKLDTEIEFSDVDRTEKTKSRRVKPKVSKKLPDIDLKNPLKGFKRRKK